MPLPANYRNMEDLPSLAEGEIWYTFAETVVLSGVNTDTVAIEPGQGVIYSSATGMGSEALLALPVDGNSVIRGCCVNGQNIPRNASGVIAYPPRLSNADNLIPMMPFLVKGVIGVRLFGTVAKGAQAFCQHTAANSLKGRWGASANSSNAVAVANTEFLEAGVSGNIVPLWFR